MFLIRFSCNCSRYLYQSWQRTRFYPVSQPADSYTNQELSLVQARFSSVVRSGALGCPCSPTKGFWSSRMHFSLTWSLASDPRYLAKLHFELAVCRLDTSSGLRSVFRWKLKKQFASQKYLQSSMSFLLSIKRCALVSALYSTAQLACSVHSLRPKITGGLTDSILNSTLLDRSLCYQVWVGLGQKFWCVTLRVFSFSRDPSSRK